MAGSEVEKVLARIEASWSGLMAVLATVPDDRLVAPGIVGAWSVADLFGHLAVWDDIAVEAVGRYLAGEPAAPIDADPINARESAVRAGLSVAEQRTEMAAAHDRLWAMVVGLSDPDLAVPGVRERIAADTYDHYDEHAAEVRAWFAGGGT